MQPTPKKGQRVVPTRREELTVAELSRNGRT